MMKKRLQLENVLKNYIEELFLVDPENYRFLLVNFFRLLGIPLLAVFTIYDFLRGNRLEGIITGIIFIFFVYSFSILDRNKDHLMVYRIAILLLIINFSFVIYSNPKFYISSLWMFILPIPISFLLGTKEGPGWIIFSLLSSLVAVQISGHRESIPVEYITRFTIVYSLLGFLALIVEMVRARGYSLFTQKQNELEELNKLLYENSIRDSLTGFYNRSFLSDPLEKIVAHAVRVRTQLVFILLDIDNFKWVNDQCGHIAGDEALVKISDSIRVTLKRKSDFVIRYGGDEFLIILPDTNLDNAKVLASEIQKNILKLQTKNCDIALKASFGLVELLSVVKQPPNSNKQLITTLISIADRNLYKAKSLGGNTFVE